MAESKRGRFPNTSIIKPNDVHDSSEFISDDDNHQISSISSLNIDTSRQRKKTDCDSNNSIIRDRSLNNNHISSEKIREKSTSSSYQSSHIQLRHRSNSSELLHSHSPNHNDNRNEQPFHPIGLRPSYSLENISHSKLNTKLTNDSGTGESILISPTPIPSPLIHYEIVPIYGQQKRVLMANRYNFDQKKIDEYIIKYKYKTNTKSTTLKQTNRQPSTDNSSNNLFKNLLSRLKKSPKSSLNVLTMTEPLVRHHLSANRAIENH
ncbi:unnamed protein product [Rotaria sordida]|uniref:Uncharacterized protein n=1 Tax=Rotaria sordida TaxID=392033 RepID=A0A818JIU9_9BILA|nr:unnamed protein product [Rotaria sordida]CAF1354036.1 unnamed protein product [Rotaria sordida]CAF3540960.1 unnamed protein product [Rotaria sordida]CAF3890888.1 unnamed protein product [Rotaria sordida]